jgi:hypothetical protein
MKFEVLEIKDLPDGGAEIIFNLDSETQTELKRILGMKRWSNKKFRQFVIDALHKELDK